MRASMSRRQFVRRGVALSLPALMPRGLVAATTNTRRIDVRPDTEIGLIRPVLHGQFAEHLGSCIYGGLWVGKDSSIPNLNGYRRQAVEYLRELGIPVLRWPGGCFADDYHWRDGIGPPTRRPKRVNIHWGGYVEDNGFGTHEFIGLCRALGAEPYIAGNVGSGSPEPFRVRYWGVGNENWGCGGMRPEEYAGLFRRFRVYLRPFGETKPFLVACGPSRNDARWSRGVLEGLGHARRFLDALLRARRGRAHELLPRTYGGTIVHLRPG